MIKIALIGVGRWGSNILRTLEGMRGIKVLVYNANATPPSPSPHPVKLRHGAGLRGGERLSSSSEGEVEGVDGVIIATPGSTHAEIALPYVSAGVPTFIEKPMATSLKDAERLARAARQSGALVQVGHIHLYNPAYRKLKAQVERIGTVRLLQFEGMNNGPVRDDMSVLWDWGPHAVSLALDLLGQMPQLVQAYGQYVLKPRGYRHDALQLRLLFNAGIETTGLLNWIAPSKRVQLTVTGTAGWLVFDDTAPAGKKVVLHRGGRVMYPRYSTEPPLKAELGAFIMAIKTGRQVLADARHGLNVVRVLAAAERSAALDGRRVAL